MRINKIIGSLILNVVFHQDTIAGLLMPYDYMDQPSDGDTLLYIPVIVHVAYGRNEENISNEQINSQLRVLNEDYQSFNSDLVQVDEVFEDLVANPKLQFFLADTLLNDSQNGIHRVSVQEQVFTPENLFSSANGGVDPIEPERFLNIWVGRLQNGLLGFYSENGVAVDYRSFGTTGTVAPPYHLGRTLTHELGHYFSLEHLWGTGGCSSDDGVEDTPLQESQITSCLEVSFSCGSQDMTQNFMNLAEDECLLFFTNGQKNRIRSFLLNQKKSLLRDGSELVLSVDDTNRQLQAYPNPSTNRIIYLINSNKLPKNVTITSLDGGLSEAGYVTNNTIDMRDFPAGTYVITTYSNQGNESVKVVLR